jgi:hypothetical protein
MADNLSQHEGGTTWIANVDKIRESEKLLSEAKRFFECAE